jgi:hypothetical protein
LLSQVASEARELGWRSLDSLESRQNHTAMKKQFDKPDAEELPALNSSEIIEDLYDNLDIKPMEDIVFIQLDSTTTTTPPSACLEVYFDE